MAPPEEIREFLASHLPPNGVIQARGKPCVAVFAEDMDRPEGVRVQVDVEVLVERVALLQADVCALQQRSYTTSGCSRGVSTEQPKTLERRVETISVKRPNQFGGVWSLGGEAD